VDPTVTESIRLSVPATSAAVRITRAGAAGLATRAGFTYREVEQLRLAVGEAAALLAPEPDGEGTLAVVYDVVPDGLRIELVLVPGSAGGVTAVPEVAAAVLDNSVDEWSLADGGRRLVLVKRLSDTDDDDDAD
jgi:serine/threonine-protein kinase RsbW